MPYTNNDYPDSMKNMNPDVREKAIDIVNALLDENMDESIAIPTAISRARDWAANHLKNFDDSNDKRHGKDQYVIPHKGNWAIKSEGSDRVSKIFETKKEAIQAGKEIVKRNNGVLTIQLSDGKIEDRISYNN